MWRKIQRWWKPQNRGTYVDYVPFLVALLSAKMITKMKNDWKQYGSDSGMSFILVQWSPHADFLAGYQAYYITINSEKSCLVKNCLHCTTSLAFHGCVWRGERKSIVWLLDKVKFKDTTGNVNNNLTESNIFPSSWLFFLVTWKYLLKIICQILCCHISNELIGQRIWPNVF